MVNKSIIDTTCACLAIVSLNVTAIPSSVDWQTAGDALITYDPITQLEWLDLSVTAGMSYSDVSAQRGVGGIFQGWRYATRKQVTILWDHFGGSGDYGGWSTENNGLFDTVAPLMGDLYCEKMSCAVGDGYSGFLTGDRLPGFNFYFVANINDLSTNPRSITMDATSLNSVLHWSERYDFAGSALYRSVSTPEPPIALLIGSGLLGLIGITRRKKV